MTTKTISRKTKGAVAVIAGGALLLGTGATFAIWSDSAEIDGVTITAGQLSVKADGVTWEYKNASGLNSEFSSLPTGYLMIPGQTVRGTIPITPNIQGTDLTAALSFTGGAQTDGFEDLIVSWTLDGDSVTGDVASFSMDHIDMDDVDPATGTIDLVVTLELPLFENDDSNNNDNNAPKFGNNATWSLAQLEILLTQDNHLPTAP